MKVLIAGGFRGANRFGILPRIKELAGVNGTDPVFRRCSVCKRWQLYSDRANEAWRPAKQLPILQKMLKRDFPQYSKVRGFPYISDGFCPSIKCITSTGLSEEDALKIIGEV